MRARTAVLLYSALVCAALAKNAGMSPEAKKQQINDLRAQSKSPVLTMDDSTFPYYAVTKPRPYALIVFFTASHPKFKCTICRAIDREFALLAESYENSKDGDSSDAVDIFFVRLDYESSQTVFSKYGVTGVPLVFHIPPYRGERSLEDYNIKARDRYTIPQASDAEALANFVRERTGARIEIKRSMIGAYFTLVALFVTMALAVQPIINNIGFWLGLIRQKGLWTFLSLSVYTCAISGLIFDIIRGPPLYHMNAQTGQILFFYPQSGSQFVVEGFVIGFLNLTCAIALTILTLYVPKMKTSKTDPFQVRTIVFWICAVSSFFCFTMVKSLYQMKNRWYRG